MIDNNGTGGDAGDPAPQPLAALRNFDWRDPFFQVGVIVSACWSVASIVVLCIWAKWPATGLPPNEWGDLAAGFAAPLAFFWLVLGFLQQGKELRLSSRALMLQVEELRNTVKHQADLVQVTREQVEVQLRQDANARLARRLAIRPSFVVRTFGRSSLPSGLSYTIRLSNVGGTVTDVRVEFLGTRVFAAMESGGDEHFKVTTPIGQKDPIGGTIHYTDVEGGRGSIGFVATIDASQNMRFAVNAEGISSGQ